MKRFSVFLIFLLCSGFLYAQTAGHSTSPFKAAKIAPVTNKLPPQPKNVTDVLHYDKEYYMALGGGVETGAYAHFPEVKLADYPGKQVLAVSLYLGDISGVASAQVEIFADTAAAPFYTQSFTPVSGWNHVYLNNPVPVPASGPLFVGYRILCSSESYAFGVDGGPGNPNGDIFWVDGTWNHLGAPSVDYPFNFCIRARIGTPETLPAAYCNAVGWNAGTLETTDSYTSPQFILMNTGGDSLNISAISGLSTPFSTTLVPGFKLARGGAVPFTISFDPTATGDFNQTLTVTTNGGTITFNLTGKGVDCTAPISTFPWTENFEDHFPPACWSLNDADNDGYNWRLHVLNVHSGTYAANSESWTLPQQPLTPDNYLITPAITVNSANLELRYWVSVFNRFVPEEKYSVMVSTTGTNPADFTAIYTETLQVANTTFSMRNLSLAAYNGQTIYIAFRHWGCVDKYQLSIDDVSIGDFSAPVAVCTPQTWEAVTIVNQPVTSGTLTLTNLGHQPLTCTGITGISAPFTTSFTPAAVNLSFNESYTFTFTYAPAAEEHINQTVTLMTSGGNIPIVLTGHTPKTPMAVCSENIWDIITSLNTPVQSDTFTLMNNGGDTLTINGIYGISAPFTTDLVPTAVKLAMGEAMDFTFTFAPTVAADADQSVQIATSGGDVYVHLLGRVADCSPVTVYPWTEGFESGTWPATCWYAKDADGDGYNWMPADVNPHSGIYSALSLSYVNGMGAILPDDFLITPWLSINSPDLALSYWVCIQDAFYPTEHYDVMVSTIGTDPDDFTSIFNETLTAAQSTYVQRTIPLGAYNGQDICLAFRHHNSTDMFAMNIDDVTVQDASGVQEGARAVVSVYPNPAGKYVIANIPEPAHLTIRDLTGRAIYTSDVRALEKISLEGCTGGLYVLTFEMSGEVVNVKLMIQ